MFMMSKLDVLYREVERAKRIEALELEDIGRWRSSSRENMDRKEWEKRFANEALRIYPEIIEYVGSVEAKNFVMEDQIRELRVKILELEERNHAK